MTKYFEQCFSETVIPYEELQGRTVLITGASGLIGGMMVKCLLYLRNAFNLKLRLIALVRNRKNVKIDLWKVDQNVLEFVIADVTDKVVIEKPVDYIIHTASITKSKTMLEQPVEVIRTNVWGTYHILELARRNQGCRVVYLSSMEVYGFARNHELFTENDMQYLNPLVVRSSYPESKRLAENLCISYVKEYGVDVRIIRLAQTFGPGVDKNDTRVFAEFTKCALEKRNIVLHTDGASSRMYLDTVDAISAILTVLLCGDSGEAYNAANKDTYCSIKEMAELVAEEIANNEIQVQILLNSTMVKQYPPSHDLGLDVSKIEALGWHSKVGLREMFIRLAGELSKSGV